MTNWFGDILYGQKDCRTIILNQVQEQMDTLPDCHWETERGTIITACMDPFYQFNTPRQRGQKGNGFLLRQPKNVRYERTHLFVEQQQVLLKEKYKKFS